MKKLVLILSGLLLAMVAFAQTNVRAWYAQGQVWIIWQTQQPYPQTFGIYKKAQPFTNTTQATVIGRPFAYEYFPGAFISQTGNPGFRYKVPQPDGSLYTLAEGEALFVETVMSGGSAYYAVAKWGATGVTAGVNITDSAVTYIYDPVNDPVACHLQHSLVTQEGFKTNWYGLWLLGRQDQEAGRPDFPVMANAYKNGMPAMFIVSEAMAMDTTGAKRIPCTNWLHGGGGSAIQHVAGTTDHFNIIPLKGISVSHNDDFPHLTLEAGDTLFSPARTQWFGWSKFHNPFDPGYRADLGDTLVNYVQRRILWTNRWLIRNYRVDPDRVAIQGYSMGSGGAAALGKLAPEQFSTVCAFNNGFRRQDDETITPVLGTVAGNLPTNLRYPDGLPVRINEVFDLNTQISGARDLPLFRTWAGKNDNNGRMHWGPDLVAQYRAADSLGWGVQISWDERPHTYETLGFHWIQGYQISAQTFRDNLAYQELFNSKQSFPAFFNHRLDPKNNDPGAGMPGINTGDGDNWGTWGGWHNWDPDAVIDEPDRWEVTAWLTDGAPFANDNCPYDQLTADLAVRKPQQFKPAAGENVHWEVIDLNNNEVLQSGNAVVKADSLVVIPQVAVYRESIRKVRIEVTPMNVATFQESGSRVLTDLSIAPNPSKGEARMSVFVPEQTAAVIAAVSTTGLKALFNYRLLPGKNEISLASFNHLPAGLYFLELTVAGDRQVIKWVKSD